MIPVRKRNTCIVCGGRRLAQYLDLGTSALANAFLKKADLRKPEARFPLRVSYCRDCHLAQLTDIVDRKALFENYTYFSSTSPQLHEYFRRYAENVMRRFPKQVKGFILEIASNDGILL